MEIIDELYEFFKKFGEYGKVPACLKEEIRFSFYTGNLLFEKDNLGFKWAVSLRWVNPNHADIQDAACRNN